MQSIIEIIQGAGLQALREVIVTIATVLLAPAIVVWIPRLLKAVISRIGLDWAEGLILGLVSHAEKLFTGGQGELKAEFVFNAARPRIPEWLLCDDELRGIIEAVVASIGEGLGKLPNPTE